MPTTTLLIVASVLLLSTISMPWVTSKWPLWARASWRLIFLAILTAVVVEALGSPFSPILDNTRSDMRIWEQCIQIGWWLVAAQCAVGMTRLFLVFESKPRETRIVSDLLAGLIHLLAFFAIINFVFEVPVGGLLATSGVIAIVLGLALQSSLSDLFSGIAVGIERPYTAGDLVTVEGGVEGRVVQVNWRSTHIATANHDVAIIPNSVVAKSRLVNHSIPTTTRGVSIQVRIAATEQPDKCLAALTSALKTCLLISATPAPSIARIELQGDGVTYEISFAVPNIEALAAARTELLGQIQTHLHFDGLALAVTGVSNPLKTEKPSPAELLARSDWFGTLSDQDRALVAEHLIKMQYPEGSHIIEESKEADALLIVASGAVEISVADRGHRRVIHKLGPGASLGAVALIMGAAYGATAKALTPVIAYHLDREALKAAINACPDLVQSLEAMVRLGQQGQRVDDTIHPNLQLDKPDLFLPRLRHFLQKLSEAPDAHLT